MKPKARHIHVGRNSGGIEPRQNVGQFFDMLGRDATPVGRFVKAHQPFVSYGPNHPVP
jgi:hypothetical protein